MERTWLWWSSGKDSAWALETLRAADTRVTGLVTTVNRKFGRVAMHAVRIELLRAQADAAGIDLNLVEIPHPCTDAEYEKEVAPLLERATGCGVRRMAFGDLHLEEVRAYRERLLRGTGITPVFPLWGRDTERLAHTMVHAGLRAYLVCVDPRVVPRTFAGRAFDETLLRDLPVGVDPCGERGEFHTFAVAGPMFARALDVTVGITVEREGFLFADVELADREQTHDRS